MTDSAVNLQTKGGTAWHVQGNALMMQLGFIGGAGSPVGSVTPAYIGQEYYDTSGSNFWRANGAANTNWVEIGGNSEAVAITSGTIDGAAIGGTTPAAGAFTTLSASGAVSGAGVTALFASPPAIGGTAPAAGAFTSLSSTGLVADSVATGITASATQTQVGGTALTKTINNIATCATSGNAVTLAALTPGQFQIVFNNGADPASVFPATGGAIDGGSANAAVTLTNAKRCIYFCVAANTIISAQLGVASA